MKPERIIIHHSLTKDGSTVSWDAIRRWHMGLHPDSPYKMRDIGYHFGIELIGNRHEILVGRLPNEPGAHTKGYNKNSLGVCVVGNFDIDPVPREAFALCVRLVSWLCHNFEISFAHVEGHKMYAQKTCPGLNFDMELLRESLR